MPALADEPFEPNLSGHPGNLTMRTPMATLEVRAAFVVTLWTR